ncbi:hypothetical protein JRF76_08590 [Kocuria indica]|nr:hypothetical protein [Kocuria indica]MBN6843894.1 hypothetical protein [Kocuria indica]
MRTRTTPLTDRLATDPLRWIRPTALLTAPCGREDAAGMTTPPAHLLIGHRGAAGVAPENTVAAFEVARSSGAQFFELDVQLSADGVPFAFHDPTPARTTNAAEVFPGRENDPVTSFTWAELQRLDAGSSFSGAFRGERIPHFDDAVEVARDAIGVFIEIKSPVTSPGIERIIVERLRSDPRWQRLVRDGRIEVLGFDAASNQRFAVLAPEVPLQQLVYRVPDAETLALISTYAGQVGSNHRWLNAAAVDRVRAAGLGMSVYTVNAERNFNRMVALGVDRITTDFPVGFSPKHPATVGHAVAVR